MKLSEMTNEQAATALIRITTPLGNICEDEKTLEMIQEYNGSSEVPNIQKFGKIIPKAVTHLLKTHKDDLYEIIGALLLKTKKEVSQMNLFETIAAVKDSYDEVLVNFFTSSVKETKNSEEK